MLNDTRVRTAKPADRPIKLSHSGGLHLLIQPSGCKLWRLAYRFGGKQKTLAIGAYPTVTLKHAREKRDDAKRLLSDNIVASLARPGGNATGTSSQTADLGSKRLDLLREVVPTFCRLAIMANVGAPNAMLDMREVAAATRTLGVEVVTIEIQRAEDIAPAFDALKGRADALYVCGEPLVNTNRVRISTLALAARLPTMWGLRDFVEAGGLMSYGPNFPDLYRRAADYVDKILRGAKPADIPVQQPTKFDLAINLTTAKALGIEVPATLLARADEVIE